MTDIRIDRVESSSDIELIRQLFLEYAESLGFDLGYQGFETELALLPGAYAPPRGLLLVARVSGESAGCVGVRPLDETTCEMKRLYVRPQFRGLRLGERLLRGAIDSARQAGYRQMKLDTIATMTAARALYEKEGFRATEPYSSGYRAGAIFYALDLT